MIFTKTLREYVRRLFGSFHPSPGDAELEEELRLHLELVGEQGGRQARVRAGGMAQALEAMRDQRGLPWLDDLRRDARIAVRALRRSPAFSIAALLTLAVGIGVNTAIFSVVNGVLLKPLPYPDAERLVSVGHGNFGSAPFLYFTERDQNTSFEAVGAYIVGTASVTGRGTPEQARLLAVTAEVLPILGVAPLAGRYFSPEDDAPGRADTVVLTYGYWQRRFGGDPSVVGTAMTIDGRPWMILGVMPPRFRFLDRQIDLITPFRLDRSQVRVGNFFLASIARLKPGVSLAGASDDVHRLVRIALDSFPLVPGFTREQVHRMPLFPRITPLKQELVGDAGKTLWVVTGTIGLVLLMACVNVANLMLVRGESRQKELSVRAALGAARSRIARQLLTESAVLGAAGAIVGIVIAYVCLRVLLPIAPGSLPRMDEIRIDVPVLLFAVSLSLVSTMLFGAITLGRYARPHFMSALRLSPGSSGMRREGRARDVLVVVQVALALVLLIAAGLMIRTFRELRAVEPGFSASNELQTAQITIPFASSPNPAVVARRHHDILDRIAAVPGVMSVAFTNAVPVGAPFQMTELLFPEGKVFAPGDGPKASDFRFISPGFFSTMRISIITGRDLTWTDVHERRPVVLVSENLARTEWGSPAQAIGQRLRGSSANDAWRQIVGVVADVRDRGLTEPAPMAVYFPFLVERLYDNPTYVWPSMTYAIRSPRTGTRGFLDDISRAVWAVDPSLPLANTRAMDEILGASIARTSFAMAMLATAGMMALLLGLVGVYGVIAYAVAQRTQEFGIRLALGAQPTRLKLMVLRRGLVHACIGIAVGLGAASGLTRTMSSLLFGIGPRDPITFVFVPLLLTIVIVLASYVPARRAAAVNPVNALRAE